MDLIVQIDELVIDGREPDPARAVAAVLEANAGTDLDPRSLAAAGQAIADAASAAASRDPARP